jgi:hypothetical protein
MHVSESSLALKETIPAAVSPASPRSSLPLIFVQASIRVSHLPFSAKKKKKSK